MSVSVPTALLHEVQQQLRPIVARHDFVQAALVFGSIARGIAKADSDLDVALACQRPLTAAQRTDLIAEMALATNRPIDLVDLLASTGPVLREALTQGVLIFQRSGDALAESTRRLLFYEADEAPLYRRARQQVLDQWLTTSSNRN